MSYSFESLTHHASLPAEKGSECMEHVLLHVLRSLLNARSSET